MTFHKYRNIWSSGYGDWEYSDKDPEILEEDLRNSNYSNYGWRGSDIRKIDLPPKEWVMEKIIHCRREIKWTQFELEEYQKLLHENYGTSIE